MLQELFVLGFWVTIATIVFSFSITLVLYLIAGLAAAVGWVVAKIKGEDF